MKKHVFYFLLIIVVSLSALKQKTSPTPVGFWMNPEQDAKFEIFSCGTKLCGKITWLKEPLREGRPKIDLNNPDPSLKNQPILGMVFMKDFEFEEENKWDDGNIYDPKNGKTYSCYLQLLDKDKMEVKGYIGISLIGRSQIWTRAQ